MISCISRCSEELSRQARRATRRHIRRMQGIQSGQVSMGYGFLVPIVADVERGVNRAFHFAPSCTIVMVNPMVTP